VTDKTGKLVGIMDVAETEDLIITCKSGITIRMKVSDISEQGRATQGVKLIRIDEGDEIAAITKIDVQDETGVITENEEITETTNLPEDSSEQENGVPS
jgi:DNA gyrase subunit A